MIGGSILMVFCLFMISITKPEQYYQACLSTFPTFTDSTDIPFKLFLAQGLGIGIAAGITYIPAIGLIPHYFQRRRALALGIATTVSYNPLIYYFHTNYGARALLLAERFIPLC
jgi:MFS family permease